ncbi:MAG: hypothetical protein HY810_05175 [Candidatus Omnitrophica bacterium]|nr:hypothetical protein [Candidatus Omnitrophota bacterium]
MQTENILKNKLEQDFDFRLNTNQFKELQRLLYEIEKRGNTSYPQIISTLKTDPAIIKAEGKNKFFFLKQQLIKLRFPLTSQKEKIDAKDVFLNGLKPQLKNNITPLKDFFPEKIFIEEKAKNSYLAKRFQGLFPTVETEFINHSWEYAQKNKFQLSELKAPLVFIVSENWDYIKPCPCTKGHLGCNYWILNLGFGCPYDCSYCFLQQYANFPGITLPANLDDFFEKFNSYYKNLKAPIRIGTGEFSDSLALDHITNYSEQLVNFFRNKNVLFELKTKSSNIENLLMIPASKNIVISWSLNPQETIDKEEINTASLLKRLTSAKKVIEHGYTLSFHFDPVIYSENWEKDYQDVIELIYNHLSGGFRWISIGTLRGTRKLKTSSELRFPGKNIFYGELFLGKDKKLRYPKFLRKQIYSVMLKNIRKYDPQTPVYLCMEDDKCWQEFNPLLNSPEKIEQYLLKK